MRGRRRRRKRRKRRIVFFEVFYSFFIRWQTDRHRGQRTRMVGEKYYFLLKKKIESPQKRSVKRCCRYFRTKFMKTKRFTFTVSKQIFDMSRVSSFFLHGKHCTGKTKKSRLEIIHEYSFAHDSLPRTKLDSKYKNQFGREITPTTPTTKN